MSKMGQMAMLFWSTKKAAFSSKTALKVEPAIGLEPTTR